MKLYFNLSGFGTTVSIARLSKSGGGCLVASSATGEKEKHAKYTSHLQRGGFCLFTVSPLLPVLPSSCSKEALATQEALTASGDPSIPWPGSLWSPLTSIKLEFTTSL